MSDILPDCTVFRRRHIYIFSNTIRKVFKIIFENCATPTSLASYKYCGYNTGHTAATVTSNSLLAATVTSNSLLLATALKQQYTHLAS
jgi:hypothetical protein